MCVSHTRARIHFHCLAHSIHVWTCGADRSTGLACCFCCGVDVQGSGFNNILRDAFGDTQIEDLWIRYFCVSTNVSKARMQIHQAGPLWKYARASMTVRVGRESCA